MTTEYTPSSNSSHLPLPLIPDFLKPRKVPTCLKEVIELQFENFFPTLIERISEGESIKHLVETDGRNFQLSHVLKWIMKDPERTKLYEEAQLAAAEIYASQLVSIADGGEGMEMEDVQRSSLRIKTRQYLMEVYNRKKYGSMKQVEIKNNISISQALSDAESRIFDANYREV